MYKKINKPTDLGSAGFRKRKPKQNALNFFICIKINELKKSLTSNPLQAFHSIIPVK